MLLILILIFFIELKEANQLTFFFFEDEQLFKKLKKIH